MTSGRYPEKVDVVIAGGGIVGASSLYHLVRSSDLNVLLLDARGVNYGSTARSAAAFRHQFSSKINIQMSLYSGRMYDTFHEDFGTDELLVKNGYLFLYSDRDQFETAKQRLQRQRDMGVPDVQVLTSDDIPDRFPHIESDDIVGGTWCPHDGFIRPERASRAFIHKAFEYDNTMLEQNSPVTDVFLENEQVTGVQVDEEHHIETSSLVNAAGAWCHSIARAAGVRLPVAPVKRYLYFTNQFDNRDVSGYPMTVRDLGPYVRPEHNGFMMGWDKKPEKPSDPDEYWDADPDMERLYNEQDEIERGFGLGVDGYGYEVLAAWAEWMPFLKEAGLTNLSSGYYQITPDSKAIISEDPRVGGLVHAVGFSGHGVMHAPATGRAVADLVLNESSTFDLDTLELNRFLETREQADPEEMVL